MEITFLIAGMAAVTYATRLSMIAILGHWQVAPLVRQALHYVPVAAFAAIIAPELVEQSGHLAVSFDNVRLLAGVAAIVVAALTRRSLVTIIVGMGLMWVAQFVLTR